MNRRLTLAISILTVLVFSSLVSAQPVDGENYFEAELEKVTILSQFEGKAMITHVDPNYVITLKLQDGSQLNYAIHSPSRLFGGDYKVGNRYSFVVNFEPGKDVTYRIQGQ